MQVNNLFFNWVINQPLLKQSNFEFFSFNLCNLSFFNYWYPQILGDCLEELLHLEDLVQVHPILNNSCEEHNKQQQLL
jgi:hypothetical protein